MQHFEVDTGAGDFTGWIFNFFLTLKQLTVQFRFMEINVYNADATNVVVVVVVVSAADTTTTTVIIIIVRTIIIIK